MSLSASARAFARAAYRGRTIRRRLPSSVGSPVIYVAPDSQLSSLDPRPGRLSPELVRWAISYCTPGSAVWDIGANVGVFTFACAGLGAQVLAVEADPFLASTLQRTRRANSGAVSVLGAAISSARGLATLQIPSTGRASSSLAGFHRRNWSSVEDEITVPTLTLDDLLEISRPSLVKIDIEGAELAALQGAESMLSSVRPSILMEVGGEVWTEMNKLLARHKYRLVDPDYPNIPAHYNTTNVLAIPE